MGEGTGADAKVVRPGVPGQASLSAQVRPTRLERALDWAASLAPSPMKVATSCCGMSMAQGGDFFEALGTGPPAVSSRSADLLVIAGSITHRQVPMIRGIYERMLEPRWVIAWGACAISGGAYNNYATIPGLGRVIPVDLVVPGCPPPPAALREALELLRSGAARDPDRRSRDRAEWPILRTEKPPALLPPLEADARTDKQMAKRSGNVDRG
jgi:NADH-quinone oxidoreductase subunit B